MYKISGIVNNFYTSEKMKYFYYKNKILYRRQTRQTSYVLTFKLTREGSQLLNNFEI